MRQQTLKRKRREARKQQREFMNIASAMGARENAVLKAALNEQPWYRRALMAVKLTAGRM